MKISPVLIVALCFGFLTFPLLAAPRAEFKGAWHRVDGSVIDGTLVDVFGNLALIRSKKTNILIGIDSMTEGELDRVNEFVTHRSSVSTPWKDSTSAVAIDLKNKLRSVQDGKLRDYDPAARTEPDFYLVYFSASWCPPCHRFTPVLIKAYDRIQQRWPGRVEVVLVSSDRTGGEAEEYMIDAGMPWLMLRYGSQARALTRWAGNGIPCLVAVARNGDVMFHSYQGDEYIGPDSVLEKCEQLLPSLDGKSPAGLRARHRLAVRQHRTQTGELSSQVKPYLLQIHQSRSEFVPEKGLLFNVEVDENGKVTHASLENDPYSPVGDVLKPDISEWLFLPAIDQGKPVKSTVKVPLARPRLTASAKVES
jgi:thiol-disulfide isomerase/thioredoxin